MKVTTKLGITSGIIIGILIAYGVILIPHLLEDGSTRMMLSDSSEGINISGVYFHGKVMCIDIDRNVNDVEKTINHEYLHYLIDTQEEHFCK